MKGFYLVLSLLVVMTGIAGAQQIPTTQQSIHQIESNRHHVDSVDDSPLSPSSQSPIRNRQSAIRNRSFGYRPYWSGANDHLSYNYSALTTIGYFSLEVDTAAGGYSSLHSWRTTPVIAYAHGQGVRVVLVVTNFGYDANDKILGDPSKSAKLINTIVTEVRDAGGDGVNIDFELVRSSQRANLVSFMRDLASAMRSVVPNAEISMATPAVDWSNAFDLASLAGICDYLVLMGYDYYWSSAPNAGPVAPLNGGTYNVTRSIDTYLAAGVPPAKLLLGVPWYGYDWPVKDTSRKSATTGTGKAVTYKNASAAAPGYGKLFDQTAASAWYRYNVATVNHQAWYDDSLSLALKYGLVVSRQLGGIGIWALGYDGGRRELFDGIIQAFGVPLSVDDHERERSTIRLYPNPVQSHVLVQLDLPQSGDATLRVHDALGRVVYHVVERSIAGSSLSIDVDVSGLASGLYSCRVECGLFVGVNRFVVAR